MADTPLDDSGIPRNPAFTVQLLLRYTRLLERHVELLEERTGGRFGGRRPGASGPDDELDEDEEIL